MIAKNIVPKNFVKKGMLKNKFLLIEMDTYFPVHHV